MPKPETPLRPATSEELEQALSFALRFKGRKRVHNADQMMAEITAGHLAEHLRVAGFVVMKKPPEPPGQPPPMTPNKGLTE